MLSVPPRRSGRLPRSRVRRLSWQGRRCIRWMPIPATPWPLSPNTRRIHIGWLLHLIQFLGVVLMFIGFVAIRDAIRNEPAEWIARLGLVFGASAMTTAAIVPAVDRVALEGDGGWLVDAPLDQKQGAFMAAFAVAANRNRVGEHFMALLSGVTAILYGMATRLEQRISELARFGWEAIGGLGTV